MIGFKVTKDRHDKPIDLLGQTNNPRIIFYKSLPSKQVIIEGKIEHGRGLDIFSLSQDSNHPFIYAITHSIGKSDFRHSIKTILMEYYNNVRPFNIGCWLGVDINKEHRLYSEPAWSTLFPWENVSIDKKKHERKICAIEDNKEHGSNYDIFKGWRNFGPVSEEILNIETNRLVKLVESIQKKGFIRENSDGTSNDIGAIVLMKEDGSWRWLVEYGGQHRAAVLSALNYKLIPLKVWQVIDERDVNVWPNVISGVYSRQEALAVFNTMFDSKSNNVLSHWEEYILENNKVIS